MILDAALTLFSASVITKDIKVLKGIKVLKNIHKARALRYLDHLPIR